MRDHGYQWRDDHGAMRHGGGSTAPATGSSTAWTGHDGAALVHETRALRAAPLCGGHAWTLHWFSALEAAGPAPVELGSPGASGRVRAGYGDFFWRLPLPVGPVDVFTPDAAGEAVHGHCADWLAFAGTSTGDGRDLHS